MKNKVGKNTQVWRNQKDGRVVCGKTVQEALGVGWMFNVGKDWLPTTHVPLEDRVVIDAGRVLPQNDATIAIATNAHTTGLIKIKAYGREYSYTVLYVDGVRVIIK